MFDPPEMVPYTKIDEKELDSAEHRAQARKLANESMVLLKNDGLLPLKPGIKKIAVVGPLADQTRPLIGNYAGQPTHIVSMLDGLKAEFPERNHHLSFPGTQFLRTDGNPVPDSSSDHSRRQARPEGGLQRRHDAQAADAGQRAPTPIVSRTETNVKLTESNLPRRLPGRKSFGVQWSGFLTPTGIRRLPCRHSLRGLCKADGRRQAGSDGVQWRRRAGAGVGRVHLEKGQKVALSIIYGSMNGKPHAELIWAKVNNAPSPEAIAAAKNADVVIAVVGITSQLEGEEMPVS